MGGTITMVTQEGTTITIPAHELATQGAHSVTMVTADGTDEQVSSALKKVSWCTGKWGPLGVLLMNFDASVDLCNFVSLRWPSWLLTWPLSKQ